MRSVNVSLLAVLCLLVSILAGCGQSSLEGVPNLSDTYDVHSATIGLGGDELSVEYPSTWGNGIMSRNTVTGQIQFVQWSDGHIELHGNIGGVEGDYNCVVSVMRPEKALSYKDCISVIHDSIIQNVEGINESDILTEDKGDYTTFGYSDDGHFKTYIYKYNSNTIIIITSAIREDASQDDLNTLSNIVLGMMKSIRPTK